ncbi:MAG: cytochrome C biogenesis protein [Limnochordia bacterium]
MDYIHCKLEVFVPKEYVGKIVAALGEIGVGKIGNYDHCFSTSEVTGYWRPLAGAESFLGELGTLSSAPEVKLETRLEATLVDLAVETIERVHPYEEPVINVFPLLY